MSETPDLDKARESANRHFLSWAEKRRDADAGNLIDMLTAFAMQQRAEEAERSEKNRFRGCHVAHELGKDGACCNCAFGERAADLRRQAGGK